ncbi:MAG TPA: pectinesterase family protein [Terracidiphilus sp.]
MFPLPFSFLVHCRLTASPGEAHVYLVPPWRPYASVAYLNTQMRAHIEPAGWREWHSGEGHNLDTVFYAENKSSGPEATPAARDPHSHQIMAAQARQFKTKFFLAGTFGLDSIKEAKGRPTSAVAASHVGWTSSRALQLHLAPQCT